jgi:hypothetical protein
LPNSDASLRRLKKALIVFLSLQTFSQQSWHQFYILYKIFSFIYTEHFRSIVPVRMAVASIRLKQGKFAKLALQALQNCSLQSSFDSGRLLFLASL